MNCDWFCKVLLLTLYQQTTWKCFGEGVLACDVSPSGGQGYVFTIISDLSLIEWRKEKDYWGKYWLTNHNGIVCWLELNHKPSKRSQIDGNIRVKGWGCFFCIPYDVTSVPSPVLGCSLYIERLNRIPPGPHAKFLPFDAYFGKIGIFHTFLNNSAQNSFVVCFICVWNF